LEKLLYLRSYKLLCRIIAVKLLPENAYSSIRCNFEFISNVTDVSDLELEKLILLKTETDEESHTLQAHCEQRKSRANRSITPSSTTILRENVVTIVIAPLCEAH
jgi:hypothetical protein